MQEDKILNKVSLRNQLKVGLCLPADGLDSIQLSIMKEAPRVDISRVING